MNGESDVWECQCRAVGVTGCMFGVCLNAEVPIGFIYVLKKSETK